MKNTDDTNKDSQPVSRNRVRFGIILWVVSYLPFPVLAVNILHGNGKLTGAKQTSAFVAIMWGIQIVLGLVGLYIAGKEAIGLVKDQGLKKLPKNLWLVIIGRPIPESE